MNKTIIVTGCAGLLGSHVSRYFLQENYTVVGIDDLSGGYKEFLPNNKNFVFYEYDLSKKNITKYLNKLFKTHKPIACYHFAAYAAEGLSPFIRHFNYTNNILSSVNIINQCIQYDCKLIFTSSMAVYGAQKPPFDENMIPSPTDPYGIAKFATELDIKVANDQHNLRYTILRPHNVIGIYQNIWDKYRNVVGIFIRQALNNKPLTIYGDGTQTRAFSDIKYFLIPFSMLIDSFDQQIFNIGADKIFTINELAKTIKSIAEHHKFNTEIIHLEPRHEVQHAYCDHTKAKSLLKFTDNTNLENLIHDMFIWAKDQPNRETKKMKYEINKNIYNYWK